MRPLWSIALLLIAAGCGGGGGNSAPPAPPPHVPGISNFTYTSASSAKVGDGGGAVTVTWTFDFIDSGKDVNNMVWEGLDASGNVAKTLTTPLTGASGMAAGLASGYGTYPTTTAGTYNWRFHVTDVAGNSSNSLSAVWTVTPSTPLQSPPSAGIIIEEWKELGPSGSAVIHN